MKIEYKGTEYGLCFETDFIDVFCFELGYQPNELTLPFEFKKDSEGNVEFEKDENGNVKINPDTKEATPITVVDNNSIKKFRDYVYSFLKADFVANKENKGVEFPLTLPNVTGIVMSLPPDITAKITLNLFKSLSPNLTKAQLKAMEEMTENNDFKKKSVGQKLKPVPIAKLD